MLKTKSKHVQIAYTLDGNRDRDVLVFSNSLGTNHHMWDAQIEPLKNDFFIVRYDTRGHGESEVVPGESTIEDLGQDVLDLMDELGIETFHFCGLSIGGLTAQWLGVNAPNRLKKLVMCNTATKIWTKDGWNGRIETVNENGLAHIVGGTRKIWFTPEFSEKHPELVEPILTDFVKTPVAGYIACCSAVRDADFTENIHSVSVPTLIFAGSQDPVTTVEHGEYLKTQIKESKLVKLHAAHISNVEQNEIFTAELKQFLNK